MTAAEMNFQITDLCLCACLNKIVTYLIKPYLLNHAVLLLEFKVLTNMKSVACLSSQTRAKNYLILKQTKTRVGTTSFGLPCYSVCRNCHNM